MVHLLLGFLLAAAVLACVSLQKTYHDVKVTELKRRARGGDAFAATLYKAAGYGLSLEIFLWALIGVFATAFFIYMSRTFPLFIAGLGIVALIWFGFAWMPNAPTTYAGRTFARILAPVLNSIMDVLYPLFVRLEKLIANHRPITVHTGLYEKGDLLELIEKQRVQIDNRITKEELDIARHALTFGHKKVADVMTPRKMMKTVAAHDLIGPVLLDELHKTGHSRFPVHKDKADNIIGVLYLYDIVGTKDGGFVKDNMSKRVQYVHEQAPISEVLHVFLKTHQHLCIVVNDFEEIVGVISLEDVLEQILGKQIMDEFDKYEDLRAVAMTHAKKEQQNRQTVVESSEETVKKEEKSEDAQ